MGRFFIFITSEERENPERYTESLIKKTPGLLFQVYELTNCYAVAFNEIKARQTEISNNTYSWF